MQNNWLRRTAHAAAFLLAFVAASGTGLTQSTTQGGVAGTVFDASDAVVANATVLIHNEATAADVRVRTDESGTFRAPLLPPGSYTITITAPGFSSQKQSGVLVQVNQVTSVNPHLATGSTTETVEVVAATPVLNFESPEFGGHLDTQEIESIPINNRRWSSLALTTPGVTNDASGFGLLSFRAIPAVLNNVQIDGADDNQAFYGEERGRTRAGYSTSQISVREFQVNTGVYTAEFGRAVGGVVNSVTKSGGNQLHGEVYFYHRGDEFSSKNEKVTLTQPVTTNGVTTFVTNPFRPKDKRNQYGFGVGGPLVKDKFFWFYSFDAFRRNFPGTSVPANPNSFYNQSCTTALLTATGVTSAQCQAALADLSGDLGTVPRFGNQLINTPKIDWQLSPKHHVSFLYHRLRWDSPGGVQTGAAVSYARDTFGTDFVKLDYGVAKLDSLLTSTMTNELRYQYARELNDEGQQPYTSYTLQHFVGANGIVTYASINGTSTGFNAGSPYYSFRAAYPDERKWQIGDTASWSHGRHSIRFGIDFVHNYDLQNNLYQGNGSYSYGSVTNFLADILKPTGACNPLTSSGTPTLASSSTGGGYGCHSGNSQGFGPTTFDLATMDTAYFAQDDWKLTPNLTVNLGVRYDYQQIPGPYSRLITAPQTTSHPSDKNNVSARVGFAYDPFGQGKSVVRGGFGMYYGRILNAVIMNAYLNTGSPNGQASYTIYNGTNIGTTVAPSYLKFPNTATVRPTSSAPPSIVYLDPHLQNPYTEQFDLAVQQDLGYRNVLSVSYLGALGRELPNYLNVNLDPTKYYDVTYTTAAASNGACIAAACGTKFTQRVYSSRYANGTVNTLNPNYTAITDVLSNANSSYHALSVDITNRQWHWITFDANYTWSHALDFNVAQFTNPGSNNYIDPFANQRNNYGTSSLNVRHRATGWAVVNIPGIDSHNAVSYVTNGWSVRPLVQIQSGLPYSYAVSSGSPGSQTVGCTSSANCLAPYSTGVGGTGVSSYIPFFGRNTLTQPRDIVLDGRLQKDFKLHEKTSLQVLVEGFNLANHRNITGVNTGAFSLSTSNVLTATTNFGQPSSSGVNGNYAYQVRQFQFGARILF